VLADVLTGRVLYARDMHRPLPPASTTKVLTAVLVLERLSPDAQVTVSPRAAAARSGSAIGLEAGERLKVTDLLAPLLLRSANDAAVALAEAAAGSVERFADLMNSTARRLGARRSRFTNPHGLHAAGHYSTAYDLAVIARAALRQPVVAGLVRMQSWTLDRAGRPVQVIENSNRLLRMYPGADGVKTGWTVPAGYTLVASATREGWQLLAVVLRSTDMYADASALLDYGFGSFSLRTLATKGQPIARLAVGAPGRPLVATVPRDVHAVVRRGAVISHRVSIRDDLRLPVPAGGQVGEVRFIEDGVTEVARAPLVAERSVGRQEP
jgi:D-alanyl-D-alanine carboxypeptidase (penicillin-binding protein 5/6)